MRARSRCRSSSESKKENSRGETTMDEMKLNEIPLGDEPAGWPDDSISSARVHVHEVVNKNPDSIEMGTPAKGGAIKVYGDFNDPAAFKKKIEQAKEVREYAKTELNLG